MSETGPVVMSTDEIVAFLEARRTGVLALPSDDRPYAIPVSYAFNATERELLVRLGHLDGTEKDQHLQDQPAARIVVHDDDEPRSVIADGTLVTVEKSELSPEDIRTLGAGETPAFDLWPVDKPDLDVSIHRLTDATLTGRKPIE